jgi:lipid-binding SYLF domain-containing protein
VLGSDERALSKKSAHGAALRLILIFNLFSCRTASASVLLMPSHSAAREAAGEKGGINMKAIAFLFAGALINACATTSSYESMQADVDQAVSIIERFEAIPERAIPAAVMRDARGLAILNVTKAGFIGSVRGGTGIVVARTEKGWSGPSAIGTGGLGFGFQAGAEVSELVIVLNTAEAVNAFAKGGNVTLGGALGVAAGPVGRTAEASLALGAAMYTYSRSQGLFAGVSLEGTVIATRDRVNAAYYGEPVSPREILTGKVQPPAGAQKLLAVLSRY